MDETRNLKTPIYILNAVMRYNEKNREVINKKAKDSYNEKKNDPEFIAKRREYGRIYREKQKNLKQKKENTLSLKMV